MAGLSGGAVTPPDVTAHGWWKCATAASEPTGDGRVASVGAILAAEPRRIHRSVRRHEGGAPLCAVDRTVDVKVADRGRCNAQSRDEWAVGETKNERTNRGASGSSANHGSVELLLEEAPNRLAVIVAITHARIHAPQNKRLCIPLDTAAERVDVDLERQISAAFPMMNAEITTKKFGSKWHGYIDGRPDLDETALSEEDSCSARPFPALNSAMMSLPTLKIGLMPHQTVSTFCRRLLGDPSPWRATPSDICAPARAWRSCW